MTLTKEEFLSAFRDNLFEDYCAEPQEATPQQIHSAVAKAVMSRLAPDIRKSKERHGAARRAYYFSAEFLVGRAVYNNLLCLGLTGMVEEALRESGCELSSLEEIEDAALGNGGLGRLAACFLDSAATLNLPLDGYGIRYRYGLFKQSIVGGCQMEEADDWTRYGDAWAHRREGDTVEVKFADQTVRAVPYDMPVIGYSTENVGNLRLWQAESVNPFDFQLFNDQKYDEAVTEKNRAEDISRVLYPNDNTLDGKILRLKQQYFFCAASIADIIKKHKRYQKTDISHLAEAMTIQLNDTHPVVAIPELIRQLMTGEGYDFESALRMACGVFNYTNHTIMAEALEKWPLDLMNEVIPEIAGIIEMIDNALVKEMLRKGVSEEETLKLRIISKGTIHMARLAIFASNTVNGVARIHSEILKHTALKEWYAVYPERFQNKTNGVTQRRWLALCNPELTALLAEKLGSERFITDLYALKKLAPLAEDADTLRRFMGIKREKKVQLAQFVEMHDGVTIDPDTIYDIQIKRLHEYKRQLLNAFSILHLYFGIKDGTIRDFYPTTFLFGAKSAPGYARAKGIIQYINQIGELVNNDPATNKLLKVVFIHDYNVSAAEKLVAAADVSIQISTAGTEASGTGNMKLMLNGAVTLGTLDGANVEIAEEAGPENEYIFGAKVEELETILPDYEPKAVYEADPELKRVVDTLIDGRFDDGGNGIFKDLYDSLLVGTDWQRADNYYVLGDFRSFIEARLCLNADYRDHSEEFARKCFRNVCCSGKFSSDDTIRHYAAEIWKIEPVS